MISTRLSVDESTFLGLYGHKVGDLMDDDGVCAFTSTAFVVVETLTDDSEDKVFPDSSLVNVGGSSGEARPAPPRAGGPVGANVFDPTPTATSEMSPWKRFWAGGHKRSSTQKSRSLSKLRPDA